AKSALYPSLSLSAGLGSNYYKTDGLDMGTFDEQIKNNFSQYVGLSLNIPIFDKLATRNSIRSSRLAQSSQALKLQYAKNSLYKEIHQAYHNAVAARSRYYSSKQAAKAAEESFTLVQAKYESGKASITEFNESKNASLKSESDLAQARYEWMYQAKLLDFYKGIEF
ncbi:MAG TPA: TolC family protein, partial [Candidatus Cryptobacteroides sp.]|nr:TolC family protein [Candidatus Cryptobacteroides sp.]